MHEGFLQNQLNVLNLALTIFFGLLSLVLYLRGRPRKRVTFTWDAVTLQNRAHPGITMLFKGKPIENLFRFRVVVWNSGTQEIRRTDIPSGAKPCISLFAKILSVAHLDASAKIDFAEVGNSIEFNFEYLNPNDWVALEILLERDASQTFSPHFEARFIGGSPPDQRKYEKRRNFYQGWIAPAVVVLMLSGVVYAGAAAFANWLHSKGRAGYGASIFVYILALGLIVLTWFGMVSEIARVYQAARLPDNARTVFEKP
jgi:hypothetical protein